VKRCAIAICLSILSAGLAAGCGSDSPDCSPALAPDGVYPGYDYCSAAHYPDFTDPNTRWDGSYAADCAGTSGEDAFACSEQLFWEVLQFDIDGRAAALPALRTLADRVEVEGGLTPTQLGRLFLRIGQLAVLLVTENGDTGSGPLLQSYLERARDADPGNLMIEAWYYTVLINAAVVLGQNPDVYLDEMWQLYEESPAAVAGALMGVALAMPVESGWPAVAVDLVEGVDQSDCGDWCDWEFHRAPYGMPGQLLSYAEVYARVGDRANALHYLELTRESRYYDEWQMKAQVEELYADVDAWIGSFAAREDDETVTDLTIGASDQACRFCHGARPAE